ncbi:hypothetical protein BJX61DRAFT_496429 [Aspergillus egyptiacus]|nr:hypothetical protein BJX61DRAFT_496429 [Aspergillus egyptiacus]
MEIADVTRAALSLSLSLSPAHGSRGFPNQSPRIIKPLSILHQHHLASLSPAFPVQSSWYGNLTHVRVSPSHRHPPVIQEATTDRAHASWTKKEGILPTKFDRVLDPWNGAGLDPWAQDPDRDAAEIQKIGAGLGIALAVNKIGHGRRSPIQLRKFWLYPRLMQYLGCDFRGQVAWLSWCVWGYYPPTLRCRS